MTQTCVCAQCGNEFVGRKRSEKARVDGARYCNHTCQGLARRLAVAADPNVISSRDANGRTTVQRACNYCGEPFFATPTKIRDGEGLYCSKPCANAARSKLSPEAGWLSTNAQGYIERRWHNADTGKTMAIREHRHIWEAANGPIPAGYAIHHIDGHRDNNALSNLLCLSSGGHAILHHTRPEIWTIDENGVILKRCSVCGIFKSWDGYPQGGRRPRGECKECKNLAERQARSGRA